MNLKRQTVCFTGHREIKDRFLFEKTYKVVEELIQRGFKFFGAGGARGFDALAAEVVLSLKAKYPQIHLILVLPFPEQYSQERWTPEEITQYYALQKRASKVVILEKSYSRGVYYRRNEHLVNFSSLCCSYQYKETGGTAYTVNYAKKKGLQIINVC